jgi:Carboxypeptidase regulatory-like domain/TonB-dependent Receptor Plug Domain/TonB dependent receptor
MKRISLPHFAAAGSAVRAMAGSQATWTLTAGRAIRAILIVAMLLSLLSPSGAIAGVTGGIAGLVKDAGGAPLAGVRVHVTSPSQVSNATTDAQGHFVMLTLAPDTYTITLEKTGYQDASIPGAVVFADQTQQYSFTLSKALATIAHVTASAGNAGLVKSGVGGDLYSVNSSQAAAAAPLGGGGNLNNAYSALASVPGVQVGIGSTGWLTNAAYVRGQNSLYTGFEYDGVPINRAFDNYNASTESNLGLQELQVYTGGGPASVTSAGTSGFINQVIKTGTYPGFATASLGVSSPTFYHEAQVEAGGSTPDRNFSYYVGLSGYNQAFRILNNDNGAQLMQPGDYNAIYGYANNGTFTGQGVKPICPLANAAAAAALPIGFGVGPGCWNFYSGIAGATSQITDREDVINLHAGIPMKNGLRDDVQLLWSASALNNYFYSSPNDVGPGVNNFIASARGVNYAAPTCNVPTMIAPNLTVPVCEPSAAGTDYPSYSDGIVYNQPFGSVIATSPTNIKAPSVYYEASTPQHQFEGPLPLNDQSVNVNQNDTGIVKVQYTHELSSSAFLRFYGYSFYSDWLEASPLDAFTQNFPITAGNGAAEYQLITHTAGGSLQFDDQLNGQNLINFTGNYTEATVDRFNNGTNGSVSPIGYLSTAGGKDTCYDPTAGTPEPCLLAGSYFNATTGKNVAPTWVSSADAGPTGFGGPAGAAWRTLWSGGETGSLNNVSPKFYNFSLSDEFRPNDRLLVNAAVRYDNFTYDLPDSTSAATAFYANMTANYSCVNAATNQVLTSPLPPGNPPPAPTQYVVGDCDSAVKLLAPSSPATGWVHPNGTVQDGVKAPSFTASSPSSYSLQYWQPRFSATYTQSPDTVWRVSAGRFTQPPISASVQYLSASGDDRSVWENTMNLGYYSPFHPIPGISSAQYDASYERHITGTDMSLKLSPFFTWISNWQQQYLLGAGFATQIPVGVGRNYGLEAAFTKGDFTRNGFSGAFSFTYTNAKIQFQNIGGAINPTTVLNQVVAQYNQLTKAGGGFPCYTPANPSTGKFGTGVATCGKHDILNPYYNQPLQSPLDPNGWYNPYSTAISPSISDNANSYNSPAVASLILNYRRDRLTITPSVQFAAGTYYGTVLDNNGYDPRVCASNSADSGILKVSPKTNPDQCNYLYLIAPGSGQFGYLYTPNYQTGTFAALGSYEQPSIVTGNLQIGYEVSPKVKLTLTGTNLFHTCFGGSAEPWTAGNPPGPNVCSYFPAGGTLNSDLYPGNFHNGTSISDAPANNGVHYSPALSQSYLPGVGLGGQIGAAIPPPFNLYFNAAIKL